MLGLMGKKLGMTQIFNEEGEIVPVTVVAIGPCTVVQKKTTESDGYNALQLGYCVTTPKRMCKARRGHLEKRGLALYTHLKEFRTEKAGEFEVGQELCAAGFKVGELVDVSGVTKGRGFQGVMKRHGKHGGSIYQLEPNIKEAPGGLRDYQLIAWLKRLRDARHGGPHSGPWRRCCGSRPSCSSRR